MEMTVDEALQAAKRDGGCDEDCVTPELAAEVERLRADAGDNAKLVQRIVEMGREGDARNQEIERLRAKLKWFADREAVARRVIEYATADWDTDSNVLEYWKARRSLLDWDREHPKPHDPDELDKHLARENPDGR